MQLLLSQEIMCLKFLPISYYIFTTSFSSNHERLENGRIMDVLNSLAFIMTILNSQENFSCSFSLFFVLCHYFKKETIFMQEFGRVFLLFSSDKSLCMTLSQVSPQLKQTQEFFCYISVALTEHMLKNLHIFCSFKALYVTNFTMINEKNDSSLQEYSITTCKLNFR